ncbi:TetR/AcrR family transcriptional regulator [Hoyosella subflava]|uniref:Transcriptional regulator, TetR family protein n=1 Tax=Hoyosella subflava (strain DSM 45089 / JCM 17490 / NBRC 109087 / DQS3-9A1) TaxID=443218 RepID=F6EHC0_HOYSD|nr:TetR/AcrR family transcriptional regulator [Hoyosella subflava]AEF41099.1 Transcriptional regulator, TetR family protein [Hoyosella subflava DQS3-9A1]
MPESAGARRGTIAAGTRPPAPTPRRRPKDRKAQIARIAAEMFSTQGYNQVGIDDIAREVGVSGPALYRHFPNKYALFRHVALTLADVLVEASTPQNSGLQSSNAEGDLQAVLLSLIRVTIEHRKTGGLYRWEDRYLNPADRRAVRDRIKTVNRNVSIQVKRLRPGLSDREYTLLSGAALSVIGSITAHRTPLSEKRIQRVILEAAQSALWVDAHIVPQPPSPPRQAGLTPQSKREQLLKAAIQLFFERGYHDVSIEEIGAAADLNASGVYRYFESKSDLLAAAFARASERLTADTTAVLAESTSPLDGLRRLVDLYVSLSSGQQDLMSVYFTEVGSLPAEQRRELNTAQRLYVEEWATLLEQVLPGRQLIELRFLVHASLALALDIGRLVNFEKSPGVRAFLSRLMRAALLID